MRGTHRFDVAGTAAWLTRSPRLAGIRNTTRDTLDSAFIRLNRPPLQATLGPIQVRGFLRHRSYLADAARPGRTYRELFARSVRAGMTVVDGGAHIGSYTVLASRLVGPSGRVLAFEPDPYNFAALTYNVERFAEDNVSLQERVLGEGRRQATFHLSGGTIGSSLRPRQDTIAVRAVDVTSVDAELGEAPEALVVKLNVEGAEALALDGMRETLARTEDVAMFVEVDPEGLAQVGMHPAELVERIEGHGFEVFSIRLSDQSLVRIDSSARLEKGHVFCSRGR